MIDERCSIICFSFTKCCNLEWRIREVSEHLPATVRKEHRSVSPIVNNVNERSRVKRPMSINRTNNPIWPGVNFPLERKREVTHSGRMTRRSRWKSGFEIEVKFNVYRWWVSTTARSCWHTSRTDNNIVVPSSSSKIRWRISTGKIGSEAIVLRRIVVVSVKIYFAFWLQYSAERKESVKKRPWRKKKTNKRNRWVMMTTAVFFSSFTPMAVDLRKVFVGRWEEVNQWTRDCWKSVWWHLKNEFTSIRVRVRGMIFFEVPSYN